jgi:hypothetical protein
MNLDNGFLIVASVLPEYVASANFCAGSIKDCYPDAHITMVVPQSLSQYVDRSVVDIVIDDEDVPNNSRTKLYALSRTPYTNLTVYVDADMECWHEDVATIWSEMPEDADILITNIRPYNGKEDRWPGGETIPQGRMEYHGGFFMYRTNPQTIDFMKQWWIDYQIQRTEPWPYAEHECRKSFGQWDQFTLWKLMNIDKKPVNVQVFKDDARWNFVNGYRPDETDKEIIFWHHTIPSRRGK